MSHDDSEKNTPKPRLEGKVEANDPRVDNSRLDKAPDAQAARGASACERDQALDANPHKSSGSASHHKGDAQKGTIEIVDDDKKTGEKRLLSSRHVPRREKDFSNKIETPPTLTHEELLAHVKKGGFPATKLAERYSHAKTEEERQAILREGATFYPRKEQTAAEAPAVKEYLTAEEKEKLKDSGLTFEADFTKTHSLPQTIDGVAKLGLDRYMDLEIQSKLDGFKQLASPPGSTPENTLQGAVTKVALDGIDVSVGIGHGSFKFVEHTVEGLVGAVRMASAYQRMCVPIPWMKDPEGTKMLTDAAKTCGTVGRVLLQLETTLNPRNKLLYGVEFDPEGTAMTRKLLESLPGAIKQQITNFETAGTEQKVAGGTEAILNILALAIGGGAGAATKGKVVSEVGTIAKVGEEMAATGEAAGVINAANGVEKLSIAETLSRAQVQNLQTFADKIAALKKFNPNLENISQALDESASKAWKLIDEGLDHFDNAMGIPKKPQVAYATADAGQSAGVGAQAEKDIGQVLFMKGHGSEFIKRAGKGEPLRPTELLVKGEDLAFSSKYKGEVYITGDQKLVSAGEAESLTEKSMQALKKMDDAELKQHGLLRLSPEEADKVISARLQEKIEEVISRDVGEFPEHAYAEACAEMRVILETFHPEILDRNLAFVIVETEGKREIFVAANMDIQIPGTLPKQANTLFPVRPLGRSRASDSEQKLLEFVGNMLTDKKHIEAKVTLFSEQYPCAWSCRGLVRERWFKEFPNDGPIQFTSKALWPNEDERIDKAAKLFNKVKERLKESNE